MSITRYWWTDKSGEVNDQMMVEMAQLAVDLALTARKFPMMASYEGDLKSDCALAAAWLYDAGVYDHNVAAAVIDMTAHLIASDKDGELAAEDAWLSHGLKLPSHRAPSQAAEIISLRAALAEFASAGEQACGMGADGVIDDVTANWLGKCAADARALLGGAK